MSLSPTKLSITPTKAPKPVAASSSPVVDEAKLSGNSLKHLYRVIQKSTGAVGGYGHNGPVYGEITMGTFQKIVDVLCQHTGFDASSSFLDIGSGLGKPNLHVALNPGVKLSFGIEVEELRWQLSMHNLRFVLKQVSEMRQSVVYFGNKDVTEMGHFEPFTHVYMFDVGFPPSVLVSIANAFNLSKSAQALISFTRPEKVISVYGFAVELITQLTTRMNGSSETHTAYIYRKLTETRGRPRRQLQLDRSFLVNKAKEDVLDKRDEEAEAEEVDKENVNSNIKAKENGKAKGTKKVVKVKIGDKVNKKKANEGEKVKSTKDEDIVAELLAGDYNSWVSTTGLIGAPGERSQRAATRKH